MTQIFSLYCGREGVVIPTLPWVLPQLIHPQILPPPPLPGCSLPALDALLLNILRGKTPRVAPGLAPSPSLQLSRSLLPRHPRVYSHF